jgi:hypothetical protein
MRGILIETEMQAYRLRCLADDVDAQAAVPDHGYQPDPVQIRCWACRLCGRPRQTCTAALG